MPDIALIGAGSVGSLLASTLLASGIRFTWVVRNPLRRAELAGGLKFQIGGDPARHSPTDPELLVEQPSEAIGADWIILAVKAQHVLPLLAELTPYPGSKVLVVANGIHEGPFHLGLLFGGAYLLEGILHTGALNRLIVGPLGGIVDWSAELLSMLPQPWFGVDNENDVELRMWRKAALNCIVNPLTALLDCENGALLDRIDSPLINGLLDELTILLYHATNGELALAPGELRSDLTKLVSATAANSSSMREDLRHDRETEIELLNGAVVRLARQYGLDFPLNNALAQMLPAVANRKRL